MLANIPSLRNAFAVTVSALALCISTVSGDGTVDRQAVTIWSQGVRLADDIYTPSDIAEDERLPGVLMIAGWGGNKNNVGRNYAEAVAAEGYVVLDALLMLGYLCALSGQNERASQLFDEALDVDPLTPLNHCMPGFVAVMEGRYADALPHYRRFLELDLVAGQHFG